MSGVSKDNSHLLKFGRASKCSVSSKASKLLGSFKGPCFKSKTTKKDDGKECTFETSVKCKKVKGCDDEPARWETSANWTVGCTKQLSGLTFLAKYEQDGKQWKAATDWGELYPGLHFYSGAKFSNASDCNLYCACGVIWGSKAFGFASQISRQFCDNTR